MDLWDGHRPKDPNLIGGLQHQFAFAALSLLVRELHRDSTYLEVVVAAAAAKFAPLPIHTIAI